MNLSPIARAVAILAPETDASLTLAERPERLHGVWSPLEQILDRIESTGEIDTARGRPVFSDGSCWYEIGPAVAGIVEFHERAQQRHGIAADTAALAKLAKKREFGVPLFAADLAAARECITQRKRDERDRKRASGLIPVQEWVHREDADRLRRYAARLRRERDRRE